jgi:hypothetical protein
MVTASADGGRTWKDGAIAALSTALLTCAVFGCLSKKRKPRGGCDCRCVGCRTHHGAASSAEVVVFDADVLGGGSRTTIDAAADFLRRNAAEAKAAVPPVKAAAAAARLSRQQVLDALSENTFTDDQLLFKTQVCRCGRALVIRTIPSCLIGEIGECVPAESLSVQNSNARRRLPT